MSKKSNDDRKRRKKLQRREQISKRRTAVQRDGDKRMVIQQGSDKGYNVEMIRDFLEQLLWEVRLQHFENVKSLRALDATQDLEGAFKAATETSATGVEQLVKFHKHYASGLVFNNYIDGRNASEAETTEYVKEFLKVNIQRRDEQVGHLEALQKLFEEALQCAKMPFGVDQEGHYIMPQIVHQVREAIE